MADNNYFSNPNPQYLDDNGKVLNKGTLTFYAAGSTSKLQDTFTETGLSNANVNPIILDSAGRSPTAVFMKDLGYNVVLSTSAGALVAASK